MAETLGNILKTVLPIEEPDLPMAVTAESKRDPNVNMQVLKWRKNSQVEIGTMEKPLITDPKDAIIRVTSTSICGSDLHLFHGDFQGMHAGDVMGHEFMGVVEQVGEEVKTVKPGDRVVVSSVIACGDCEFCKKQQFSACDTTNPSTKLQALTGSRCAGFFGYGRLTGGWQGGQAEFNRVPYADVNLLPIPDSLRDEQVLFLSDILCTAWRGIEMGEVKKEDVLCLWGCGPVGLLVIMLAKIIGCKRIIAIDCVPNRLKLAEELGAETINFKEKKVIPTMLEICPEKPDVCIDATGFRYAKEFVHKIERALYLETDACSAITEAIYLVKKFGRISVIGDYFGMTNHFSIGTVFEKGLTFRAGVVCPQKDWKMLLKYIEEGKIDLTRIITHTLPLNEAPEGYRLFDEEKNECIKVVLKPAWVESAPAE